MTNPFPKPNRTKTLPGYPDFAELPEEGAVSPFISENTRTEDRREALGNQNTQFHTIRNRLSLDQQENREKNTVNNHQKEKKSI